MLHVYTVCMLFFFLSFDAVVCFSCLYFCTELTTFLSIFLSFEALHVCLCIYSVRVFFLNLEAVAFICESGTLGCVGELVNHKRSLTHHSSS